MLMEKFLRERTFIEDPLQSLNKPTGVGEERGNQQTTCNKITVQRTRETVYLGSIHELKGTSDSAIRVAIQETQKSRDVSG